MTAIGNESFNVSAFERRGIIVKNKPLPDEVITRFLELAEANAKSGKADWPEDDGRQKRVGLFAYGSGAAALSTAPEARSADTTVLDDLGMNAAARTRFEAQLGAQAGLDRNI